MHNLTFSYRSEEDLVFGVNYQYYLRVPVLCDLKHYTNRKIRFLVDTGAYITMINSRVSLRLGFDKLPSIVDDFPLTGIGGACKAALKEIPGMIIGDRTLKGVKIAIPHDETKYNILGLNVLEHFKFLIDTNLNKIYFCDNPNYRMPNELKCADVLTVSKGETK